MACDIGEALNVVGSHAVFKDSMMQIRHTGWLVLTAAFAALPQLGCSGQGEFHVPEFLKTETPGQVARNAFNVYDADTRRRSVEKLSAAPFGGEEAYVKTYRLLIDDPDPTVRAAAAKALGMHGDTTDALTLSRLLRHDETSYVRWEAAKGLQRIHNPSTTAPLMQAALEDRDPDVRMAAAYALGQYPSVEVFGSLVSALEDRNFGVIKAAERSLELLTGQDLNQDSAAWLAFQKEAGPALFADQQTYTFQPYQDPGGFVDSLKFWDKAEPAKAQKPRGLEPEPVKEADESTSES